MYRWTLLCSINTAHCCTSVLYCCIFELKKKLLQRLFSPEGGVVVLTTGTCHMPALINWGSKQTSECLVMTLSLSLEGENVVGCVASGRFECVWLISSVSVQTRGTLSACPAWTWVWSEYCYSLLQRSNTSGVRLVDGYMDAEPAKEFRELSTLGRETL